jgi:hypothetical protein
MRGGGKYEGDGEKKEIKGERRCQDEGTVRVVEMVPGYEINQRDTVDHVKKKTDRQTDKQRI